MNYSAIVSPFHCQIIISIAFDNDKRIYSIILNSFKARLEENLKTRALVHVERIEFFQLSLLQFFQMLLFSQDNFLMILRSFRNPTRHTQRQNNYFSLTSHLNELFFQQKNCVRVPENFYTQLAAGKTNCLEQNENQCSRKNI